MGVEVFHHLKAILKKKGHATSVGDEGGFAPNLALERGGARDRSSRRSGAAGYKAGAQISLALDVAASEFHEGKKYVFKKSGGAVQDLGADGGDVREVGEGLPASSPSRTAWARRTGRAGRRSREALGTKVQLVGDDLFVTNPKILAEGIAEGHRQLGPGQGEPDRHAHRDARLRGAWPGRAGYTCMMSHRSGETEDATIADLAVATNCGQIKTGSASRTDRMAKYNQLLRIEEELGPMARFAGRSALNPRT